MFSNETIVDAAEWCGRQQAFAAMASYCSAAQALALKQLRENRGYEALGLDWEQFCIQRVGLGRERVDQIIRRLDEFGAEYFNLSQIARVSPEVYRELAPKIEDNSIELDGERVALTLSNARRIRAAVQKLRKRLAAGEDPTQSGVPGEALRARVDRMVKEARRNAASGWAHEWREVAVYAAQQWNQAAADLAVTPAE